MAKHGVLERIRLEEAQGTNERLDRMEAQQAEILELLRELAAKSEDPKTAKAKAEK